jgi:hypothetical protein
LLRLGVSDLGDLVTVQDVNRASTFIQEFGRFHWALIGSTGILLTAVFAFGPVWQTNDDVALSMLVQGSGLAKYSTPVLVFSTVTWGAILQALQWCIGPIAYAAMTLSLMTAVVTIITFELLRREVPTAYALSFATLLFLPSMVFPQFTMLSGYLTLTGLLLLLWSNHDEPWSRYALAVLLCLLGFAIRPLEFIGVCVVALPLFFDRSAVLNRHFQISALLICVGALSIYAVDRIAYMSPEQQAYIDIGAVQAAFIDFAGGLTLAKRPDLYAKYGYSANDIKLLTGWFLSDPALADPVRMKQVLAELPVASLLDGGWDRGFKALSSLFADKIQYLTLTAGCFLFLARKNRVRLTVTALLILAVIFTFGVLQRSGIFRVYVPMISLVAIAGFASSFPRPVHPRVDIQHELFGGSRADFVRRFKNRSAGMLVHLKHTLRRLITWADGKRASVLAAAASAILISLVVRKTFKFTALHAQIAFASKVVAVGLLASFAYRLRYVLRNYAAQVTLLAAMLLMVTALRAEHSTSWKRVEETRQNLKRVRTDDLSVIWGASFPYEYAYPLLEPNDQAAALRFYGLGALTLAPALAAQWQGTGYTSLSNRLLNGPPIGIFAGAYAMKLLEGYCAEHFQRKLVLDRKIETSSFRLYYVSCNKPLVQLN